MSNRRSSKSGRKRRRSPSHRRSNDLSSAVRKREKGSFIALVLGITTTLLLGMFLYSALFVGTTETVPTLQTNQVANTKLDPERFADEINLSSSEELVTRLRRQRAALAKIRGNDIEREFVLSRQIKTAEKLTEIAETVEHKEYAAKQLLMSHKSLYGLHALGRLKIDGQENRFRACFEGYLNHINQDIYREAHVCELVLMLFEVVNGNRQIVEFADLVDATLRKFPGDEKILGALRNQFDACIQTDIAMAKTIGETLLRRVSDQNHPAAGLYQYFLDRYYLIDSDFTGLFANRYVNGKPGLRELEKKSIELIEQTDIGPVVINEVNKVANWFESQPDTSSAKRIYEAMIACAADANQEQATTKFGGLGKLGLIRLAQISKAMSLDNITRQGEPVDVREFDNRVVGVLFLKVQKSSKSLSYLTAVYKLAVKFKKNLAPVKMIIVPTTPLSEADASSVRNKKAVVFCDWLDGKPPVLLEQFPVTNVPCLVILDHNKVLRKANVSIRDFEQEINLLLDRR